MAELTDEEFEAATRRGGDRARSEPCAVAAHFDADTGRLVVELANGCARIFPAEMAQELHRADPADLVGIEIDGAGFNLLGRASTSASAVLLPWQRCSAPKL